MAEARVVLVRCADDLEKAERNAAALDMGLIQRQIETLERRRTATVNRKSELERQIAGLEARILADECTHQVTMVVDPAKLNYEQLIAARKRLLAVGVRLRLITRDGASLDQTEA